MAQSGSAPVLGTGGRKFESYRPDQIFKTQHPKTDIPRPVFSGLYFQGRILLNLRGVGEPIVKVPSWFFYR